MRGGRAYLPNTMRALVSRAGSPRAVPLRVPVLALSCLVPRDLVVSSVTSFSPPPLGGRGRTWLEERGGTGGREVGRLRGVGATRRWWVSAALRAVRRAYCLGDLGGCDGGVASERYRYAESLGEREREHVRRLPRSGATSPRDMLAPREPFRDGTDGLLVPRQELVGRETPRAALASAFAYSASWTLDGVVGLQPTVCLPPASQYTDSSRSIPSNSILYTSIPYSQLLPSSIQRCRYKQERACQAELARSQGNDARE